MLWGLAPAADGSSAVRRGTPSPPAISYPRLIWAAQDDQLAAMNVTGQPGLLTGR